MANRTHYLQYYIHLTDKNTFDVAEASVAGSAGWLTGASPDFIAGQYGAPKVTPSPGQRFDPPCLTSGYFSTEFNYPTNVDRFQRKSGGWFGIHLLFGDTHTYIWAGDFTFAGTPVGTSEIPTEPTVTAMPARIWVEGFENGRGSGPVAGNASDIFSRSASRHVGGFGFDGRRGGTNNCQHNHNESGHAAVTGAWERIYVRLRQAPNVSSTFWQTSGSVSANAGVRMRWNISGQIELVNSSNTSVLSTIGTTTARPVNEWNKLDILYKYGVSGTGFVILYVNGVRTIEVLAASLPVGTGLSQAQNVANASIRDGDLSGHNGGWDFDDWICSDLPIGGSDPTLFPQRDWNTGSKVVALRGQSAAASNGADFVGIGGADANDWRYTMQRPVISSLCQGLTTTVASPRLAVVSDADRRIDFDPMNRGLAAASIGGVVTKAAGGANDSTFGLTLPAAGEVSVGANSNLASTISDAGRGSLVHAGALTEPLSPLAGTELSFVGNTTAASTKSIYNLIAQVECLGNFYVEDYVPQTGDPVTIADGFPKHWINDTHHGDLSDSPYAIYGQGVPSIVVIHGRTYVGNGKTQTLAFRTPPTWIVVRNTATHQQSTWHVASVTGRTSSETATRSTHFPRVYIDPNFAPAAEDDQEQQTILVIAGNDVAVNANAVTYNIMAFCDAGQRFSEAGALWEFAGSAVERFTTLNNPTFTPEHLQVMMEQVGTTTTRRLHVKGLGTPANDIYKMNAAALVNSIKMNTGSLSTLAASPLYINSGVQDTFLALRRDDGSGDVGVKNVMQLASYTGDGTASRTITLGPATGRRPMWAMVFGSNGVVFIRDASHTGTTSVTAATDLNNAATGITGGGVDSISVGSLLNTNNINFEVLVFPGCDATAGNGGWGINCESIPVEPLSPVPPYAAVPPVPVEPVTPTTGGTPSLVPTGTIEQCAGPSTLVINGALTNIGISKQLTSTTLNTEVSPEATIARLHFDEDVRQVLRDFPWPFATRYELLTQIMGPASESTLVQGWSAAGFYILNSVVRVATIDYYCILANTGQPVTDPVYWSTVEPTEANGDWVYAYRSPTFSLFNRRVVNNNTKARRGWDEDPPDFRVGSDDNGALIYSDEVNAELEYTIMVGCVANQGDALFRKALTWRHAHSIAMPLTRDKQIATDCWQMYQRLLRDARGSGAQEQQQAHEGDPEWITGRS